MKDFLTFLVVVSVIVAVFASGMSTAYFGECKYRSIASYHPAYILTCELLKPRFEDK